MKRTAVLFGIAEAMSTDHARRLTSGTDAFSLRPLMYFHSGLDRDRCGSDNRSSAANSKFRR